MSEPEDGDARPTHVTETLMAPGASRSMLSTLSPVTDTCLSAGLDEFHQTQDVDVEPMFFQKLFDATELVDRQRESRWVRLDRPRLGPIEIEIRRFVVTRR